MMPFQLTVLCPFCSKPLHICGEIDERLWRHRGVGNSHRFIAAEVAPFSEDLSREMLRHVEAEHQSGCVTDPSGS